MAVLTSQYVLCCLLFSTAVVWAPPPGANEHKTAPGGNLHPKLTSRGKHLDDKYRHLIKESSILPDQTEDTLHHETTSGNKDLDDKYRHLIKESSILPDQITSHDKEGAGASPQKPKKEGRRFLKMFKKKDPKVPLGGDKSHEVDSQETKNRNAKKSIAHMMHSLKKILQGVFQ